MKTKTPRKKVTSTSFQDWIRSFGPVITADPPTKTADKELRNWIRESSAPMVEVPSPTPITVKDKINDIIVTIDRAMNIMRNDPAIDNLPLESALAEARQDAFQALAKLS